MKISIIIVTYNSINLMKDCIDSIYTKNDIGKDEIEIIVVDNSNDIEGEKLKLFLDTSYSKQIKFIKNKNLGYGQGNNVGVKVAKGDFIAIMNPDVRLKEPLFGKVLEHFNDKSVASIGFQQINKVSDFSFYRLPELHIPFIYSILNRKDNRNKKFNQNSYSLSGAFVFFRKSDFVEIGMYDEDMFMYLEEPDLARRINDLGKKVIYDSSIEYIHLMDHKDDYNEFLLDIGTKSIAIYFTKHNLDLKKYIKSRILEHKLHKLIFSIFRNINRVNKANAYIKSLKKANEFQKEYLDNK